MPCRTLVSGCLASLASTLILAPPIAAQAGRDLLLPEPRAAIKAERLSLVEHVDAVRVTARDRGAAAVDRTAASVRQAATEVYQYDDDEFRQWLVVRLQDTGEISYEMEFAQRFRLRAAGTVEYATVCMLRDEGDTEPDFSFSLTFYSNVAGRPGAVLENYELRVRYPRANAYSCIPVGEDILAEPQVEAGQFWVAISWRRGTPPGNTKLLALDTDGTGGRRAFRARLEEGDEWESWRLDTQEGVYGIRLAVNHPDPEPEPEPDPEPDPDPTPDPGPDPDPDAGPPTGEGYTDCVPQTTPLVFDGGYNIRMCYETSEGTVGEGKAGIWASGQSGLLWFFTRDNAEVLIKVLKGCGFNNHWWVYVAPVTDLAFNLYVIDSEGNTWSHHNRQGDTASTRSDNEAFRCSN